MATPLAAASPARKAAIFLFAGAGAGYAVYYGLQAGEVAGLEAARGELETKAFVARGRHRRAESDIAEADSLIVALTQQTELDGRAAAEVAEALDEARARVAALEAQQQQKLDALARARDDIARAVRTREAAAADVGRFEQESKLAEHALKTLDAQVMAARAQLNPLNHPRVKEVLGRR